MKLEKIEILDLVNREFKIIISFEATKESLIYKKLNKKLLNHQKNRIKVKSEAFRKITNWA